MRWIEFAFELGCEVVAEGEEPMVIGCGGKYAVELGEGIRAGEGDLVGACD